MSMNYEYLATLRNHPTWRLLAADSAPFIISFFHLVFIKPNRRSIPAAELIAALDDYLFNLRQTYGDKAFPRAPRAYLDVWSAGEQAYLRKYYPRAGEEAEYDLTPASEKVIEWLTSLEQKRFVGSESRLLTIFRLLRDIAWDAATEPADQIDTLEKQKAEIEAEIQRLKQGQIPVPDSTRLKERFLLAEDTARRLMFDFRQMEENFRDLDQKTRERIALSDRPKGRLLDEIFGEEDSIRDSDQGRSFGAFWAYMISPASQTELDELLQQVMTLPEIREMAPGREMTRLRFRLLEAGEKVNQTCALLVEQLRKFLDDRAWLENRRIMAMIRDIEKQAVQLRQKPPVDRQFTTLDHIKAAVDLPMARGLFRPLRRPVVDDQVREGEADFATPELFRQHYVDERELQNRIRVALRGRSQITLEQLCQLHPVEKGLSEIVAYLHLASKDELAVVDTDTTTIIEWRDPDGNRKVAHMPRIIFTG